MNEKAIDLLLDAIFFEHWARYFCFQEIENSDDAKIVIPEILWEETKAQVPHLYPLMQELQNSLICLDDVRSRLFSFVAKQLNLNENEFAETIEKISVNSKFNRKLNVFYGFVQEQADKDAEFEDNLSDEEYKKYREELTIPLFLTWIESFYTWAKDNNYVI